MVLADAMRVEWIGKDVEVIGNDPIKDGCYIVIEPTVHVGSIINHKTFEL